ncbi:MAG TPA: hypothetical protein VF043_10215 [Ktedonobacteraceae bacterium]
MQQGQATGPAGTSTATTGPAGTSTATAPPNTTYDLVSTLYHELESEQTCESYILDADEAGKPDLSAFFAEVKQDSHKHAERAKQLLGISAK